MELPDLVPAKQSYHQTKTLLGELKQKLKLLYKEQWDTFRNESCMGGTCEARFFFTTDEGSSVVGFESLLSQCRKNTHNRALVIGKPNFGKSLLCSLIPYHWAEHGLETFELCFCLKTQEIARLDDWQEFLRAKVSELLGNITFDQQILTDLATDKVLIIADDLDVIKPDELKHFFDSFTKCACMENYFLLATSRQSTSINLTNHFKFRVVIAGFDRNLFTIVTNTETQKNDAVRSAFYKNSKLFFLNGFPAKYVWFITEKFYKPHTSSNTLFDVLYSVMISQGKDRPMERIENASRKLGQVCLNALQYRHLRLTKSSLESISGEDFQLIWELGAFVDPRNQKNNLECPTVLVVFFATLYLRHSWDRARSEQEKVSVINNYFCNDGSIGGIVTDDSNGLKYFVGAFPEVVLKLDPGEMQFEMYYDVSCEVEQSSAFDSVNLLMRLGRKCLPRYAFKEVDELDMQEKFADIINLFEFDGTVNMDFFENAYEDRYFMEWNVESPESDEIMLQGVVVKNKNIPTCSANTLYFDKLYLTFCFSKIELFDKFLLNFLNISFRDEQSSGLSRPGSFIKSLVRTLHSAQKRVQVSITISDATASSPIPWAANEHVSFQIFTVESGSCNLHFVNKPPSIVGIRISRYEDFLRTVDKACQAFKEARISMQLK